MSILREGKEYTGKEVNDQGFKFYVLTDYDDTYNGFQYQNGSNANFQSYDSSGAYEKCGLNFFDRDQLLLSMTYSDEIKYIRIVKIPDDAKVFVCKRCYKADKLILGERSIYNLSDYIDYDICMRVIKSCGWGLKYVPEELKTGDMCSTAIKSCGMALGAVPKELKTEEMCLIAVTSYAPALEAVPKELKTEEMCLIAVKSRGTALQYVPVDFKTEEMCLIAVQKSIRAFEYVPEYFKTEEMCLFVAGKFRHMRNYLKTVEICLVAVKLDNMALEYVPEELKPEVLRLLK